VTVHSRRRPASRPLQLWVGLQPDKRIACGSAFRPTTGNRKQRTEDSRAGDSRGGASSAGQRLLWVGLQPDKRIACGSAFRPTHFIRIATEPVGLKPDPPPECRNPSG